MNHKYASYQLALFCDINQDLTCTWSEFPRLLLHPPACVSNYYWGKPYEISMERLPWLLQLSLKEKLKASLISVSLWVKKCWHITWIFNHFSSPLLFYDLKYFGSELKPVQWVLTPNLRAYSVLIWRCFLTAGRIIIRVVSYITFALPVLVFWLYKLIEYAGSYE